MRRTNALVLFLALFTLDAYAESSRPNVVFILADDLGYGDVGANNPMSKIPTPGMDRLAAEGIRGRLGDRVLRRSRRGERG